MSPFANKLKEIRANRNLQQRTFAEIVGYEQSYICALETDAKVPPQGVQLLNFLSKLELTEEEKSALLEAAEKSQRIIKLPMKADEKFFHVIHELKKQASTIKQDKLEIISLLLKD